MKFFLVIIFVYFFCFNLLHSDEIPDDENYYKKGIELYENADFDESFVIFFNLAKKGNKDALFNLSNMYREGVGTVQDFSQALKYTWLCALNGNKKCIKKIKKLKENLNENDVKSITMEVIDILENDFSENKNPISAFKLGYWFENFSPEIDLEKAYLWYSVSVSGGVYKAMKMRDKVAESLEKDKISKIQLEANEILTREKYFSKKEVK